HIVELEGSVRVALGEREIFAIWIAEANVALCEREAVARAAAVEPLVRRAAHALRGDDAGYFVSAIAGDTGRIGTGAYARVPGVDDRRVGEANGHVISGRAVFLEEARLAHAQEGV